jgi:hypothetical protein
VSESAFFLGELSTVLRSFGKEFQGHANFVDEICAAFEHLDERACRDRIHEFAAALEALGEQTARVRDALSGMALSFACEPMS